MNTQKLLVIGQGRHGKDTVCEILRDDYGLQFISSSRFVLDEAIWNEWGASRYAGKEACYKDRGNNRALWFDMIAAYNTPDKTRTVTGMFAQGYSIYCGLRSRDELNATRHLFDKVVWVDRGYHLPPEPFSSMQLNAGDATHLLDNNGGMFQLKRNLDRLMALGAENDLGGIDDTEPMATD